VFELAMSRRRACRAAIDAFRDWSTSGQLGGQLEEEVFEVCGREGFSVGKESIVLIFAEGVVSGSDRGGRGGGADA
jgi:hypothetical protein